MSVKNRHIDQNQEKIGTKSANRLNRNTAVPTFRFTEDDKWYRAIITNIDTPGIVKVHYIDYGNKENLDMGRIRPLPNQLTGLQAQSIRCSLRGFSKETRFSPELMDQFKHTVTDRFVSNFLLTLAIGHNYFFDLN